MDNFDRRIKRIRKAIGGLPAKVKVIFKDRSEKVTNDIDAIKLCLDKNAVSVERIGDDCGDNFICILQSLIDTDIDELWADRGDVTE